MGRTLTLGKEQSDLLIAFTGFFIAFSAGYHQLQATLRNSSSPDDGLRLLSLLLWTWRKSPQWFRPLPTIIVAAFCTIGFTVAGGFSSRVSTAMGREALVDSMNCGYPMGTIGANNEAEYAYLSTTASSVDAASNYAEQCYSDDRASLSDCSLFVTKRLTDNSTINKQAPCPFHDSLCRTTSKNIRLDTGFLDSHSHLGLNARQEDRIIWRNVLHCAPLVTEGYTSHARTAQGNSTRYHYGVTYHNFTPIDYVYEVPDVEAQYRNYVKSSVSGYYNLDIFDVQVWGGEICTYSSDFVPIPGLLRSDADMFYSYLSGNGVKFTEYTDDDWYRIDPVSRNISLTGADNGTSQTSQEPVHLPSEPASPLACTNQYQFCRPSSPVNKCTSLSSLHDAMYGALDLFNASRDEFGNDAPISAAAASVIYFMDTFWYALKTTEDAVQHLGPRSLVSMQTVTKGMQGPLVENQVSAPKWPIATEILFANAVVKSVQKSTIDDQPRILASGK
ncbi:hypothetical protein F5Y15DRAFT_422835 [Xylariaceae sp. FL0016]|nr:hypothetical protein F5Y15DRAFT_422835 [Xylariaceae sp. FL0016]